MRKLIAILLLALILSATVLPVSADTGPKPSVNITFTNVTNSEFYVTLLSKYDSTGPWSSKDRSDISDAGFFPKEIYEKLSGYQDSDGFYFLQYGEKYDGDFEWDYYPPSVFKLLLYFPEDDAFIASDIYERYAFDSYYTFDIEEALSGRAVLTESYDYKSELIALFARILITFAAELLLAVLAFGYRGKRLFAMLAITNLITQLILNVAVNFRGFVGGRYDFIATFIILEIIVFAIEALIYRRFIPKLSEKSARRGVAVIYALSANALSLILGLYLSDILPKLF